MFPGDQEDNGMTAAAHGASPIGCADVVRQWPDNICSGQIRYAPASLYGGFYLADVEHGIPTFAAVQPQTISGHNVRVFNYPKQTEAIAAQLVHRWNCHDALVDALRAARALCANINEFGHVTDQIIYDAAEVQIRKALSSLHREAIAETPHSVEGVNTSSLTHEG
jgi:hypothetical protein